MKGARMRSNFTLRHAPAARRLGAGLIGRKAPARALARFGRPQRSWRISACPARYTRALGNLFGPADRHFTFSPD